MIIRTKRTSLIGKHLLKLLFQKVLLKLILLLNLLVAKAVMLKLNFARVFLSKAVLKITKLTSCQALIEREVVNQEAETRQGCSKGYLLCSQILFSKLMLKLLFWKMLLQKAIMEADLWEDVFKAPIEDDLWEDVVVDKDVVSKLLPTERLLQAGVA